MTVQPGYLPDCNAQIEHDRSSLVGVIEFTVNVRYLWYILTILI